MNISMLALALSFVAAPLPAAVNDGFGARCRVLDSGSVAIETVWPGSAADATGLRPGDVLEVLFATDEAANPRETTPALVDRKRFLALPPFCPPGWSYSLIVRRDGVARVVPIIWPKRGIIT